MTLDPKYLSHMQSFSGPGPISVRNRQSPLRTQYEDEPDTAWVFDHAHTTGAEITSNHPIHAHVICGEGIPVDVPISVHKAVGGESDFPCPGEILAAALGSCLDTSIRMIANLMGVKLAKLEVQVSLGADVRGTLRMGENVPVGFQTAQIKVDLKTECDLAEAQLNALLNAAERSCVILQTLRAPPMVTIERTFE
jgi:uncharacterized OsmC-like protein